MIFHWMAGNWFCGNYEFMNRRDGYSGLKKFYNLRFSEERICSYKDRYNLLTNGEADVSIGMTTEPEIRELDLRIVKDIRERDGKRFFPDYHETPVARIEALQTVDGLRQALSDLASLGIENDDIRTLIHDYGNDPDSLGEDIRRLLEFRLSLLSK